MRHQPETTRVGGTASRSKNPQKFNFLFEDIKEEDPNKSDDNIDVNVEHI